MNLTPREANYSLPLWEFSKYDFKYKQSIWGSFVNKSAF